MGNRSNCFANIESVFATLDKEQLIEMAMASACELIEALEEVNFSEAQGQFLFMVLGAKLGVKGDGVLDSQEKEMIEEVFGKLWNIPMETVYAAIDTEIEESEYELLEMITQLGNSVAMPFLHYVLCFAYIDGRIEDIVAERLDSIFGMNLLADFLQSGLEEVPSQTVRLEGLEAEIVEWFQDNDELHPLKEIIAHFADESERDIQVALDSLADKGVIYGGANIVGNMYALS